MGTRTLSIFFVQKIRWPLNYRDTRENSREIGINVLSTIIIKIWKLSRGSHAAHHME